MKWLLLAFSLSGCEFAYFPACTYDCGFAGGQGATVTAGGVQE